MHPSQKRPHLTFEQDFHDPIKTQDSVFALVHIAGEEGEEEKEEEETSSISSSSFHFSYPSTSSPYSHSSCSSPPLISDTLEEKKVPDDRMLITLQSHPQIPQSFCSSSTSWRELKVESTSQENEDTESLLRDILGKKVAEMVHFLLFKYQTNELITKADILNIVVKEYKDYFPMIIQKACELTEIIFGLAIVELEPINHSYVIYNTVDYPYLEMLSDDQSIPKTGLLIFILSTVFLENNCISEEKLWEVLNAMQVYAGREHITYGYPRNLLTKIWVQKKYLEYHKVFKNDCAYYEFRWGPRAHAKINNKSILEFLAKLNNVIPSSFPSWYKNALKGVGKPRLQLMQ